MNTENGETRPRWDDHVVVCVDDEPQILSSLRRLLRREPYELLTTDRPEQALAWVEEKDVSLVISDQRMPGMLGTQLIDEIAQKSPATARIILTGYPGSTLHARSLSQGVQGLLYKPWDDDQLKRTILRLLCEHERGKGEADPNEIPPQVHRGTEEDRDTEKMI